MKWIKNFFLHDFIYVETEIYFSETFSILRCIKCGVVHYYSVHEDYVKYPMYDNSFCFALGKKYDYP